MPSIAAGDVEIAFDQYGDAAAPAVLLLHGWPDDASTWATVAPATFSGPLARVGLPGVGHVPEREAPGAVIDRLAPCLAGARP